MKKLLFLFFILFNGITAQANHNYKTGDRLYIWALNGLKLRPSPSADNKHIKILQKGTSIKVLEKTDISHNEMLDIERDPAAPELIYEPVELKGHWVRVITEQNDTGYIIDNYLLPLKFAKESAPDNIALPIHILKSKTLLQKECDGEDLCIEIDYQMDQNINCRMQHGGVWSKVIYTLPKFTINELLIIFACAYDNFKGLYISAFEKNRIEITDELNCRFIFNIQKGYVTLEEQCAC